MHVVR